MLGKSAEVRKIDHRGMVFIVLAAVSCYAVTLGGTWIYDDYQIIHDDDRLRDPGQWVRFWTQSYNGGVDNLYRPLTSMTYALQYWLHGDRPWAFHLLNMCLHCVVSVLVGQLGARLSGSRAGLMAGLLFAVHPVHVEAVANVVGRAELLCALGSLIALLSLLHQPIELKHASWACAGFVLALLTKEQGMILPLLMLLLPLTLLFTGQRPPLTHHEKLNLKICFLLIAPMLAGYVVLRENVLNLKFWWDRGFLDWTINPLVRPDADRTLMPLVLLGRYAALLICPISLSPDYGANAIGWRVRWDEPWFYLGCFTIILWVILMTISIKRRNGAMIFSLLGLALTYGVVGNVVALIGTNFGERLMYLPSVFFLLVVSSLIAALPRKPMLGLTTLALLLGCVRTISYAWQWNDAMGFYQYAIRQQPQAIRLHMLVTALRLQEGEARERAGDVDGAKRAFTEAADSAARARGILPEYHELWTHSAMVATAQNDFDLAEAYLRKSLEIKPTLKAANWQERIREKRAATQTNP